MACLIFLWTSKYFCQIFISDSLSLWNKFYFFIILRDILRFLSAYPTVTKIIYTTGHVRKLSDNSVFSCYVPHLVGRRHHEFMLCVIRGSFGRCVIYVLNVVHVSRAILSLEKIRIKNSGTFICKWESWYFSKEQLQTEYIMLLWRKIWCGAKFQFCYFDSNVDVKP